jgi:hypothetical protein
MELPRRWSANLALENMLTHTQRLYSPESNLLGGLLEDKGYGCIIWIEKNTTLRVHTGMFGVQRLSPILTSLARPSLLRRLCLRGHGLI